jgi:hypothetical protein
MRRSRPARAAARGPLPPRSGGLDVEAEPQHQAALLDARVGERQGIDQAPQRGRFAPAREERQRVAQLVQQRREIHAQRLEARVHLGLHPVPERRHREQAALVLEPRVQHPELDRRCAAGDARLFVRLDRPFPLEGSVAASEQCEARLRVAVRRHDQPPAERPQAGLAEHDLVARVGAGHDARARLRLREDLLDQQALEEGGRDHERNLDALRLGEGGASEHEGRCAGGGAKAGVHRAAQKVTLDR